MITDCIIMAGGSGSRLWPASTSRKAKQFLSIPGEGTFFNAAVDRALAVLADAGENGRLIIIAGKSHLPHIIHCCEQYRSDEKTRFVLIPEPAAKSTAPAIACGTCYVALTGGGERNILVLTSDHLIKPIETFKADAATLAERTAQQRTMGVFGIVPRTPETGYGYIEAAGSADDKKIDMVVSFWEKPDRTTAEHFVSAGRFFWNSGMSIFPAVFMLEEFRRSAPSVIAPFEKLAVPDENSYTTEGGLSILNSWVGLDEAYRAAPAISFDYAVIEKCSHTLVAAAAFEWADVGSWDEYAFLSGETGAEVYRCDADGCFVDSDIPVALCGVEDLIVVVRSGKDGGVPAVLISRKGRSQDVRGIVEQIKNVGRTELL
jgi:mannose-1-phosphate guanylyltransferase/mannose-6-phosphate isomerase